MDNISYLIVPLLQGFKWFDEGLQQSLRARGWPQLTQPESIVMIHVILDINRPSDIARSMGLTRQAVHITINQIIKKGIFELEDDPTDRRSKRIVLTPPGKAMRRDAQMIVAYLADQLAKRIGKQHVHNLRAAFAKDWGPALVCPLDANERVIVKRRLRAASDRHVAKSPSKRGRPRGAQRAAR